MIRGMTGGGSSIPEVGVLLAALVASKPGGRIAEIGTAFGVGAKAMLTALAPDATFVTVESDAARFAQAADLLAGTRAELIKGDWQEVLPQRGPFDLIFFDGGMTPGALSLAIGLLAPGGVLVKDDLTPGRSVDGDEVREALLRNDLLISAEIMTTPESAAIIAARRSG
jgi:predicted O-methyltransferase YrrM